MAFLYNRRPFIWRGRSAARVPRRVLVWVEELEPRQVLATLTSNPLLLVQPPKTAATTPALVSQGPSGPSTKSVTPPGATTPVNPLPTLTNLTSGVAAFIPVNGQSATSQSLNSPATSPATPATLPQTAGAGTAINPAPPGALTTPLPPILQGVAVVPPSGPLTFADLQTITANFIGGGHTETIPVPNGRAFNPPSTPRPLPSASPVQPRFIPQQQQQEQQTTIELPQGLPQEAEAMVPLIAGFEEGPQLIADPPEEILQQPDGSVGLRVEASAIPVLAAALAAHWADRHRRPDEEEKFAAVWN